MTWQSKYNASFTKNLSRQLMAFIQRDQRDALDFVGGTGVLDAFVNYQFAPMKMQQCPAILIAPVITQFVPDPVGTLDSETRFFVSIAIDNSDGQILAERAQDYIRAVDAIFNTVPPSDFYASWPLETRSLGAIMTTALEVGSVTDLFVGQHQYYEIRQLQSGFRSGAMLELRIQRKET